MKADPVRAVSPKRVLNSPYNLFVIKFILLFILDEIAQKVGITIMITKYPLTQFKGKLKLADGSNTENKFVIIFKL